MAKRIVCKPAPEIELETLDGGDIVLLRFDVYCLAKLQEMDGGLSGMFKLSTPELCAAIIYSAAKEPENFMLEDARKLVACLDMESINTIITEFSEAMGTAQTEAQKELSKNLMAQFLHQLK